MTDPAAGGPDRSGAALVVEAHGVLVVDLRAGVATPVDTADWEVVDGAPPVPTNVARRLVATPAHQPVFLRWVGRWPEWHDPTSRRWEVVDGATLRALAASRARPPSGQRPSLATTPAIEVPGRAAGDARWPVWPVEYHERPQPNLALGLVLAAAAAAPTVSDHFDLRPLGSARPHDLDAITREAGGVLLFSHYVWSTRGNLRLSAAAKAANPRLITVHGGPNAPGYPADVERFFADNPHVDVVVHGEGEATTADLLEVLASRDAPSRDDAGRLDGVAELAGVSVRTADGVVRGPKRARVADLDAVPSPYLTGWFDHLPMAGTLAVVETNRGCPFGCTFCDWGSATRSRVRTFALERVVAEIDWLAARGVDGIFVADANFGALDRDLAIAEAIAAARRRHGSIRQVVFTFAKDTADLLIPIVDLLWDAGIDVDGNLALQTVDEPTLKIVRRTNLPQAEYQRVRQQFRDRDLPLTSDIMLGLPGSSYGAMKADVQFCLDHEITPRAHRTVLLPNAPLSAPEHRSRLGVEADKLQRTTRAETFELDDVVRAANLHRLADAFDHYAIGRLPLRFAARDHGIAETDLLESLDELSRVEPARYPALAWAAVGFTSWLVPPGSWEAFVAELGAWLVERWAIPDDTALAAVLAAQAAILPAPGATFPRRVELPHDVVAWLARQHEDPGGRSLRPLVSYEPAVLEVADEGRNDALLVANRQSRAHTGRLLREVRRIYAPSWELSWPMARPRMLDVEQHAFRYAE